MDLSHLCEIAIRAARAAGGIIQKYQNQSIDVEKKTTGSSLAAKVVTNVDNESEAIILTHLSPTCAAFDLALLSEETEDDQSRFDKDYFWCIDPMDGTLAFIEQRPGFSVSIALVAQDGTPQIGVVYNPSTDTLYHAIKGKGAFKNGTAWQCKTTNNYLTYVTDKRLKDTPRTTEIKVFLQKQVKKLSLTGYREMSGAGAVLNAIFVIENAPACMLKFPKREQGGGSIWDYAATACIFQEMGLPATNSVGGKLDLNRRKGTFMNEEGVFFGTAQII